VPCAALVVLIAHGLAAQPLPGPEAINVLTDAEERAGWRLLFDGETLSGWTLRGDAAWQVEDGAITAGPASARGFLATTEEFENFELQVDFWINEEANSGVFLRCPATGLIDQKTAVEVNISDSHRIWPTGSINEVARVQERISTVGRWNRYRIVAAGSTLRVVLNGRTTVDTEDRRHVRGPIAFQSCCNDRSQVKFRNVKIRVRAG